MLGPYLKSRGYRGNEMSANADLITVETYVQQEETGSKCKQMYILGYLGVFNDSDWAYILLSNYPLTHIYVHVK